MNVETTPELILAAAEKCPQAKEALKTLFPKVFEEDKYIDLNGYQIGYDNGHSGQILWVTQIPDTPLHLKSFGLSRKYNWEMKEQGNELRLIPTRK